MKPFACLSQQENRVSRIRLYDMKLVVFTAASFRQGKNEKKNSAYSTPNQQSGRPFDCNVVFLNLSLSLFLSRDFFKVYLFDVLV